MITHVTVNNASHKNLETLEELSIHYGFNFKNIMVDSSIPIGHGKGFGIKVIEFRKFLDTVDCNEIVMFTDGWDVIVIQDMNIVYNKFISLDTDILFSAEYFCWPYPELKDTYPCFSNSVYKYLNSGTYMGYASALKKLIDQDIMNVDYLTDDQGFYTKLFLKNYQTCKITLDTECLIFQCMAGRVNDIVLDNYKVYNKETNTYPAIFHGNGHYGLDLMFNDIVLYIKHKKEVTRKYLLNYILILVTFILLIGSLFLISNFCNKLF